jgi:hypothetical protein
MLQNLQDSRPTGYAFFVLRIYEFLTSWFHLIKRSLIAGSSPLLGVLDVNVPTY